MGMDDDDAGLPSHSKEYTIKRTRFVRLNPRFDRLETLKLLESEIIAPAHKKSPHLSMPPDCNLYCFPRAVPWLPRRLDFHALPESFALSRSESYRSGRVYGMDVSSGAAVAALLGSDLEDDDDDDDEWECKGSSLMSSSSSSSSNDKKKKPKKPRPPLRVLDLCCAPGLKLCALADAAPPGSIVEGVDVSERRAALCRSVVAKYRVGGGGGDANDDDGGSSSVTIRLYRVDGTSFGAVAEAEARRPPPPVFFDSDAALEEIKSRRGGKRKRMNKSARGRERRRLKEITMRTSYQNGGGDQTAAGGTDEGKGKGRRSDDDLLLYDRVLVDAECTTDGAKRHRRLGASYVRQPSPWGERRGGDEGESSEGESSSNKNSNETDPDDLLDLQHRLLDSGFQNLRPGGTLVYSTCSTSKAQNEGTVWRLLKNRPDASVVPVTFPQRRRRRKRQSGVSNEEDLSTEPEFSRWTFVSEGDIPGTVRFLSRGAQQKEEKKDGVGCGEYAASSDEEDNMFSSGTGFFLAKIAKAETKSEKSN